ncbi:MAG: hypothetical protein P8179_17175 [Candidatus Thiodiazotropha sp.]
MSFIRDRVYDVVVSAAGVAIRVPKAGGYRLLEYRVPVQGWSDCCKTPSIKIQQGTLGASRNFMKSIRCGLLPGESRPVVERLNELLGVSLEAGKDSR